MDLEWASDWKPFPSSCFDYFPKYNIIEWDVWELVNDTVQCNAASRVLVLLKLKCNVLHRGWLQSVYRPLYADYRNILVLGISLGNFMSLFLSTCNTLIFLVMSTTQLFCAPCCFLIINWSKLLAWDRS